MAGLLPWSARPHAIDPEQHWLTNWNTLPSQGWTTGNDPPPSGSAGLLPRGATSTSSRPGWPATRVRRAERADLPGRPRSPSSARSDAELGARRGSATTPAAARQSCCGRSWRGTAHTGGDAAGTVDPGVEAWQTLKDQLQAIALAPLGAAGQLIGAGEPNSEHLFDANIGQAYALRSEGLPVWRAAAAQTYNALVSRFGTSQMRRSGASRGRWRRRALSGAESPPPMPFFDRGTFEEVMELGP